MCKLPAAVHEGEQTTATYVITSNQAVKVGLGAGVYGSDGTDYSNGDGDMDGYQLRAGIQSVTRELIVPSGLQADQYEIDAEIWPNGEIGAPRCSPPGTRWPATAVAAAGAEVNAPIATHRARRIVRESDPVP